MHVEFLDDSGIASIAVLATAFIACSSEDAAVEGSGADSGTSDTGSWSNDDNSSNDDNNNNSNDPWYNQKNEVIANDVAALHKDDIPVATLIDEKGATIPAAQHDILTGSTKEGTRAGNYTCSNWTSKSNGQQAEVGHVDSTTTGSNTNTWNNAHTATCSPASFIVNKGAGRLYCFAAD